MNRREIFITNEALFYIFQQTGLTFNLIPLYISVDAHTDELIYDKNRFDLHLLELRHGIIDTKGHYEYQQFIFTEIEVK